MDRDAAIVCYIAGLALIAVGILLTQWTHSIRIIMWPIACGTFALFRGYDHHTTTRGRRQGSGAATPRCTCPSCRGPDSSTLDAHSP